jgi:hypothetical protein
MRMPVAASLLVFVLFHFGHTATAQSPTVPHIDSLSSLLNIEVSKLTSPALEHRKHIRRNMQQIGYANVLEDVIRTDGLRALISYLKMQLHIAFAISHRPLFIHIPIDRSRGKTWSVQLHDDWTFPDDPWRDN